MMTTIKNMIDRLFSRKTKEHNNAPETNEPTVQRDHRHAIGYRRTMGLIQRGIENTSK